MCILKAKSSFGSTQSKVAAKGDKPTKNRTRPSGTPGSTAYPSVLYSLYWVFWGGVQKKEVKKGKIVVTDVQVSTAACN
jgi:hypothetical protein